MSVIPWIIQGPNRTIITECKDFNMNSMTILVDNFQVNQFSEEACTNVSYDLRVGRHYRTYRTRTQTLENGENFQIPSGRGAIIETEERVCFPKNVFGLIIPRETMLRDGLSIPPTKVDPGYPGKKDSPGHPGYLHITVFNNSTKPFKIERGMRFCALCLYQVLDGIIPYTKGEKELYGGPEKPSFWFRTKKWLIEHWWQIAVIILSLATLIWNIVRVLFYN